MRLDQLGTVERGRSRHRPRNDPALYGGAHPFVQTGDIKAAGLRLFEYTQTYSDAGLAQSRMWPTGTLCITIAANICDTAILGIPACFPDSIVGFTATPDVADVVFVKYVLDHAKRRFADISRGATQDNLSLEKLLSQRLPIPPLQAQRRISSILGAYDDLIEVNRRRIAALEEMARRMFEEWFVRDESLNWKRTTLESVVGFAKGKKPAATSDERSEGFVPLLLIDVLRGAPPVFLNPTGAVLAAEDDTIMVMDGSGSSSVFVGHRGALGSTLGRYRVQSDSGISPYWLYLFLAAKQQELKRNNTGAAIPHANKDYIARLEFAKAPKTLHVRFDAHVRPLFALIVTLSAACSRLAMSRDLLLPRLVSGELPLSRGQRLLEAVA